MGNKDSVPVREKKEKKHKEHKRGAPFSPSSAGSTAGSPTASPVPECSNLLLDEHTLRIVRRSWEWLRSTDSGGLEYVGTSHFKKFLERCGEAARKLFTSTDMRKQSHVITPVVEWMLKNPDDSALHSLALYHAHLGVTTPQLDIFCTCFVEAVIEGLDQYPDLGPEVERAWHEAMRSLTEAIGKELDECNYTIKNIGDDRNHNTHAKLTAHRMMRQKVTKTPGMPISQPDKAGWLRLSMYASNHVKPPKVAADHVLEAFKARWVELRGQYLYYRVHEVDRPDGVVDLTACELIDTSATSKLPSPSEFSFALRNHLSPKYPWYFVCNGDDEKESWFSALRRACNRFSFIRSDLYVGQRVLVCAEPHMVGVCRWTGKHQSKEGLYVGMECDTVVEGGGDGSDEGHQYFTCRFGRGIVLPAYQVSACSPLEIQVQGDSLPTNTYTPAQFEFIKVIGKGSFGRVCKVRENSTGKIFAVKILQKAALVRESQITNIRREKSILLNIHHPFIVKLHAAFQTKGRLFLLFDFLTGGELFRHVQSCPGGHLREDDARFYYAEVALAIAHLHENNILHRDLKAENLVLDKEGHCVLTDFGFAKTVLANEQNTTRCGTLPYMAPEILKQSAMGYGFEVDWWASGVLLFLLLTGCYPFWDSDPRETMKQIVNRKIKVNTFPMRPKLSEESRLLVLRLIDKDPCQRLASLEGLKEHAYFTSVGFDWDKCVRRELTPPFIPDLKGANTKYFEPDSSGAGASRPLPKGWSRDAAFASFWDIHDQYKRVDLGEKTNSGGGSTANENDEFIKNMNQWSISDLDSGTRTGITSPQLHGSRSPQGSDPDTFMLSS